MVWLRLVGSLKLQVSFAEYRLLYRALLQKRLIILRSLLTEATACGASICECVAVRIQLRVCISLPLPLSLSSFQSLSLSLSPSLSLSSSPSLSLSMCCFVSIHIHVPCPCHLVCIYRVAKMRSMPYLDRSFSTKEPYN